MARFAMDPCPEKRVEGVKVPLCGAPFRASLTSYIAVAIRRAEAFMVEGQVGIYGDSINGPFLGYVIRYEGQPAFFEPAGQDSSETRPDLHRRTV